jgi:hypothetical protein
VGAKPAATKDTSSSQRLRDGDSPPPFCSTATKSQKTRHHHLSQSMQDKKRASQEAEAKGTKAQREQEDTVAARAHPLARQTLRRGYHQEWP